MRKPRAAPPEEPQAESLPALIHAGELARLAGLHKTTVLLAVRRGELKASHTVGRSVRLARADALAFLQARGVVVPPADDARAVVLLTERPEAHRDFALHLSPPWGLHPHRGLYDDLLGLSFAAPSAVVVDLDLVGLNPLALLRALRVSPVLATIPLLALSQHESPLPGALSHGASVALRASESTAWREAFAALG